MLSPCVSSSAAAVGFLLSDVFLFLDFLFSVVFTSAAASSAASSAFCSTVYRDVRKW